MSPLVIDVKAISLLVVFAGENRVARAFTTYVG